MRAIVYARYSSQNQRETSLADQIEVCRRYLDKQGWTLVETYTDAAISGSSRFRPGYQQLLADLHAGVFDVVVVEALDRLGRKLADVADLHDRCAFAGVKLFAVNVGEITAMHVGMLGTMAQLYLSDLREKTWRGQLGRALQGKAPGGKAFGYDVVEPDGKASGASIQQKRRSFAVFFASSPTAAAPTRLQSRSTRRVFPAQAAVPGATRLSAAKPIGGPEFSTTRSTPHALNGTAAPTRKTRAPASASLARTRRRSRRSPRCRICASSMTVCGRASKHDSGRCGSRSDAMMAATPLTARIGDAFC
jgi:DNA invertase Pin-like site-specific DNA recombinase